MRFGGIVAVDDVSFDVAPGEAFGIVGPNGAGKTTLLNCISGVLRIATGSVALDGSRIDKLPSHRLAVLGLARTFQLAEHFKSFTAAEFVMLGRLHKQVRSVLASSLMLPSVRRTELAERAIAVRQLERFGLGDLADARLADLPYGVQKRIDIARAMAADPRILLMDEPTSGVSPGERMGIVEALAMASESGVTRIIVDHDIGFVQKTCSRLLVMHNGRTLAMGHPAAILALPEVREAYLGT
jgi:ABC-type branched-subunit amino acid transport system ATPase component